MTLQIVEPRGGAGSEERALRAMLGRTSMDPAKSRADTSGRATSLAAIASQEGISVRYVGRLIRLAFLAPPLVEMIAQGRQPAELSAEMLTRRIILPPEWAAQKRLLPV